MKHENVIGLVDVFTADLSLDRFHDFYLVMPFMGTDLGKLMKLQQLSEDKVQFLVYQMLKGLKYIHSAGIIHRDLKPGNLAVNQECELKILDFGLARQADSEMTGYVVTRWYRAPEVILSWMHYTQTVDIWSVGCIMAEMLSGKPLFKGNDHLDQLTEIMKITGTPTQEFITKLQSQDAKNYVKSLPKVQKKDLQALFSKVNPQAVTVIERMLLLDPESRVTAAEALALPYFSEYREPEEETEAQPYDHSPSFTELGNKGNSCRHTCSGGVVLEEGGLRQNRCQRALWFRLTGLQAHRQASDRLIMAAHMLSWLNLLSASSVVAGRRGAEKLISHLLQPSEDRQGECLFTSLQEKISSYPVWEDFSAKATKLHSQLRGKHGTDIPVRHLDSLVWVCEIQPCPAPHSTALEITVSSTIIAAELFI
ncbi:unnamed protein product [Coregonus sp. 'balchen']|nr:unnamed protein product [Coregonus sp. 'balchen']